MAKCTTKEITQVIDVEYTLVLSKQEAETLHQVCQHIGGSIYHSARKYMDSIGTALSEENVKEGEYPVESEESSIYFKDTL